jgi:hypothetical protein
MPTAGSTVSHPYFYDIELDKSKILVSHSSFNSAPTYKQLVINENEEFGHFYLSGSLKKVFFSFSLPSKFFQRVK